LSDLVKLESVEDLYNLVKDKSGGLLR
jgi:hypothetical protein